MAPELSGAGWKFVIALASLTVLSLAFNMVSMLWQRMFWDSIQHNQQATFTSLMIDFCFMLGALVCLGTYKSYVQSMMEIHWRQWFTEYLVKKWLYKKAFFHMHIHAKGGSVDNPDQRLQEDVPIFISTIISLVVDFCTHVCMSLSMLPVLLSLEPRRAFGLFECPGWLVYTVVVWSGAGTFCV